MPDLGIATPPISSSQSAPPLRTIRPLGAYVLSGLAWRNDRLITLDTIRGYLLEVDPATDNTRILNPHHTDQFTDATSLALWEETIWFTRENSVYFCTWADFTPQHFITLSYPANGVSVWQSTVYITCQKAGYVLIFNRETRNPITRFPLPGVGVENLAIRDEELWLSDSTEQTIYCLDRATGELQFNLLTPFDGPMAVAFSPQADGSSSLYVAYAREEPYVRDNPNADPPHELSIRDRTFIHPLCFSYNREGRYTLSNGYLIEMVYCEEMLPLESVQLDNLEWRIALPAETHRQKVKRVEPIGRPFREEVQEGQRVAVFHFDSLKPNERHIFGWRALLEVRGIKYQLNFEDVQYCPELPEEFKALYLVDDDELAMDNPLIQQAAQEAIGTETNILRKVLKVRNYVYDHLSYAIKPRIDPPDVVLQRGTGSCGEYVGLLLALLRLNGVACRTVGRYKCPPRGDERNVPLEPDYNHVWIEFYVPGFGWLPMESNPDDIVERGPYPTRFFMGLPWIHAEIGKGIPFEVLSTPNAEVEVSIGDLAINHVRFTILAELPPAE